MRALVRLTAAGAASLVVLGTGCGGGPDAPRIDDQGFAQQAERICASELPPLRADLSDDDPREPEEVAPMIEARADSLDDLVDALRAIEVQPGARSEIESWFSDWDAYIGVGRRYADALKEGDPDRYSAVAEDGMAPQARISAFARANGFKSCALDGVPLPPREGL